jgi:hypothetical protein
MIFRRNFPPYTYHPKQESNCEQHMQKAYGWINVRHKNNPRIIRRPGKRNSSV